MPMQRIFPTRFDEQWDTLIHGVVSERVNDSGDKVSVLDSEKVFELLKTHHTDIFKQGVVQFIQSLERRVCETLQYTLIFFYLCTLVAAFVVILQALPDPDILYNVGVHHDSGFSAEVS